MAQRRLRPNPALKSTTTRCLGDYRLDLFLVKSQLSRTFNASSSLKLVTLISEQLFPRKLPFFALPAENLRLDRPLPLSRLSRFAPMNAKTARP